MTGLLCNDPKAFSVTLSVQCEGWLIPESAEELDMGKEIRGRRKASIALLPQGIPLGGHGVRKGSVHEASFEAVILEV